MLSPFDASSLSIAGLILIGLGFLGFFLFVSRFFAKRRRRKAGEAVRRRGFIAGLFELGFLLLLILAGLSCLSLAALQNTYRAFTDRQLVLAVHARLVDPFEKRMEVTLYWPTENGSRSQKFELVGDQWMVEGNILLWDDYLTVHGFKPGYRITRLRGRFLNATQEQETPPTVIDFGSDGLDFYWRWLFRHADRVPGIRAVFGQTVFTFPDENSLFEILIRHDGFILSQRPMVSTK